MQGLRRKGDVEAVQLDGDLSGVQVGLRHIGPGKAKVWTLAFQRIAVAELGRIAELQRTIPKSVAPELYNRDKHGSYEFRTPEGLEETLELGRQMVAECAAWVRGVPGLDSCTDGAVIADTLAELGAIDQLINRCLTMQSLKAEEVLPEGAGVDQAGDAGADTGGPASGNGAGTGPFATDGVSVSGALG